MYEIIVKDYYGQWTNDLGSDPELSRFETVAEAWDTVLELKAVDPDWDGAEFDVREVD